MKTKVTSFINNNLSFSILKMVLLVLVFMTAVSLAVYTTLYDSRSIHDLTNLTIRTNKEHIIVHNRDNNYVGTQITPETFQVTTQEFESGDKIIFSNGETFYTSTLSFEDLINANVTSGDKLLMYNGTTWETSKLNTTNIPASESTPTTTASTFYYTDGKSVAPVTNLTLTKFLFPAGITTAFSGEVVFSSDGALASGCLDSYISVTRQIEGTTFKFFSSNGISPEAYGHVTGLCYEITTTSSPQTIILKKVRTGSNVLLRFDIFLSLKDLSTSTSSIELDIVIGSNNHTIMYFAGTTVNTLTPTTMQYIEPSPSANYLQGNTILCYPDSAINVNNNIDFQYKGVSCQINSIFMHVQEILI